MPAPDSEAANISLQHGNGSTVANGIDVKSHCQSASPDWANFLGNPVLGVDEAGKINLWNKAAVDLTGFSFDDVAGQSLVERYCEEPHRSSLWVAIENCLRGVTTPSCEVQLVAKNRRNTQRLMVNCSTCRNASGRITGVVIVGSPLPPLEEGTKPIDTSSHEFQRLVDTSAAPIFGIDKDGRVNKWNKKTAEITGYSKDEALNELFVPKFVVPIPQKQESVQEILNKALRGIETSEYHLELRTKSNESRHLVVNTTTTRDDSDRVIGVVSVAQDVTHAYKYDEATTTMQELRLLVDTANAPIFGIDVDGNVNEWNNKTAEITGYDKEDAFHKPLVGNFIVEHLRDSVQAVLAQALQGVETSNYELEFVTKTGETLFLLVNVTTRRDPDNHVTGVVGVAQDITEAVVKERAMSAMVRELRQLIDTANAPIFGIDKNGDVNEWNDKTAEITGFTKEEALDTNLVETFIVPSLRKSVQEVLDNALKGIETSNYELEFRTKSNEVRYLLVNATTRRDPENNVVGVVGVAQDVTEESRRDREVQAMANELRQLVETANAPIFGIDVDGNVNEWNNMTAEITGYAKEEALNKPLVATFIDKSLKESVQEVLDNALAGKETSNYELLFITKSNEFRYLLLNATTRRDETGVVVGVVGVAQDVTESVQHDREVEAMANELRQLVDTANAPIIGIDVHGNVNEWNNKMVEITGFSKDEALNKPLVSTFIVPSLRESVQDVLDNALRGRETSNYELEFRTKDNEIRYLLVNATTRRDVKKNVTGVVGVAQDVTEGVKHDRAVAAMANELRQLIDTANAPDLRNRHAWSCEMSGTRKLRKSLALHVMKH